MPIPKTFYSGFGSFFHLNPVMIPGEDRQKFISAAYEQHGAALRRYLRQRLRSGEDARELAQEVWTRLLRIDDPGKVLNLRAYLYRVAANVVAEFQHLRHRNPVQFDSQEVAVVAESGGSVVLDDAAEAMVQESHVYGLLSRLPRTYRQIVLMRVCEGRSYEAIGTQLGLTAGTAERYCQSALTQIRRGYGEMR